jgi:uncharacterized membrane protein YhaH (DUF805 family)
VGIAIIMTAVFLASQGVKFAGFVAVGLIAILLIVNLTMIVRRLHDRNRSGWWLLPILALDITGHVMEAIVDSVSRTYPVMVLFAVIALLGVHLWILIELLIRRGTPGPNRFGPDPVSLTQSA